MILEMKGIIKKFGNVVAINEVDFQLNEGEVHALVGENGAGKSTLMKIIAGVYQPDSGEIFVQGKKAAISSPSESQKLGISIIHQELNLIPYLTVSENIFLGREPKNLGFVDYKKMKRNTLELIKQFDLDLNPKALVKDLSIGEQQVVEILKALSLKPDILIMDEPTAVLTEKETSKLFELMQLLKKRNVSIIYISHRLPELKIICDKFTVLRDGKWVKTAEIQDFTEHDIANLMVGRELEDMYPSVPANIGKEILRVEGLTQSGHFNNINFSLKQGEILGFSGLIGAGRSELANAIFGGDPADEGEVYWKGKKIKYKSPIKAVQDGFGFATEDRKETGLILDMSIANNITLPSLKKYKRAGFVNKKSEYRDIQQQIKDLNIKLYNMYQAVKNLSGGNQQKVVLAKWLVADTEIFFFDEPTRGIDVGAKREIYHLISNLAKEGKGVIVISSELPELLGICNRILVMYNGEINGEFSHEEASEQVLMRKATGL
ncbi:sugar ABC transporter ATP-binding protein [Gracilibacillus kekensis]|uniref:Ribose transport system ATP-binding protein n=1 Tax=Gracilibacillus kekensis TaxID=1027249 RepID=A0A1M7MUZ1_9BACI|nr:sugar ABC transporter ATP-binding protein [Gracilibacillus kekensis]SHM94974.1 ribose transport system ATP-binding protein [Gracilibacillus kekensis]